MTPAAVSIGAVSVAAVSMLVELRISRRNERVLLARGAVEPPDPGYPLMRVVYPAAFLAMGLEGLLRAAAPPWAMIAGAGVFGIAKLVKFWAIASLGTRWTFRVLVLPAEPLIAAGPYAYLRHPNYVAVVGELVGCALVTGAVVAGPLSVLVFGWLLRTRIDAEERALGLR